MRFATKRNVEGLQVEMARTENSRLFQGVCWDGSVRSRAEVGIELRMMRKRELFDIFFNYRNQATTSVLYTNA